MVEQLGPQQIGSQTCLQAKSVVLKLETSKSLLGGNGGLVQAVRIIAQGIQQLTKSGSLFGSW